MGIDKPYLIVWKNEAKNRVEGNWYTAVEAVNFIKYRSNPKRPKMDVKADQGTVVNRHDPDVEWLPGELVEAKMYKMAGHRDYASIELIYDSNSLIATNFKEGVATIQDVLWEVEW